MGEAKICAPPEKNALILFKISEILPKNGILDTF
jgi:hypothetical protein